MTGGINQVQIIFGAVLRLIAQAHGPGLNRNAPLLLKLHGIQKLRPAFPLANRARLGEELVGQGRFTMIDMGNNAEVPNLLDIHTDVRREATVLSSPSASDTSGFQSSVSAARLQDRTLRRCSPGLAAP